MSVERFCSRWASVPAYLVPKVLQESRAAHTDCDPEAAETEHVHVETKQAALDCTHAPFRLQNILWEDKPPLVIIVFGSREVSLD